MRKLFAIALFVPLMACAQISGPVGTAGGAVAEGTDKAATFVEKVFEVGVADNLRVAGAAAGKLIQAVSELLAPAPAAE
jgi:type IV secretory pathway TrbL component